MLMPPLSWGALSSCLLSPVSLQAKRCYASTEEKTRWQQELQRSDVGTNSKTFLLLLECFSFKLALNDSDTSEAVVGQK